jgi:hypothetical protein
MMPSPFPSDRLVLLGTKGGPAIRKGGPSPTSHLLVIGGHPYVIDCGLGVTRALVEAGMALPNCGTSSSRICIRITCWKWGR